MSTDVNVDAVFVQGSTHKVCQDYGLALDPAWIPRVILSDGCSSSPDTDFGARFLVKACQEVTDQVGASEGAVSAPQILAAARRGREQFDLHPSCLDATLALGQIFPGDAGRALIWGDGVIGAIRRDGVREYSVIRYPSGAPPYLNYLADSARLDRYRQKFGTRYTITSYEVGKEEPVSVKEGDNRELCPHQFLFPCDTYAAFFLCTDGVESFTSREADGSVQPVPLPMVMGHILTIPNFNGEFVARNVRNYLLGRVARKARWTHEDDLSVGGLYLGDLS